MKNPSPKRTHEIEAAMLEVVANIQSLWEAERRLERALGLTVDGIQAYLEDYAVPDDVEITDADVAALMTWARRKQ